MSLDSGGFMKFGFFKSDGEGGLLVGKGIALRQHEGEAVMRAALAIADLSL